MDGLAYRTMEKVVDNHAGDMNNLSQRQLYSLVHNMTSFVSLL